VYGEWREGPKRGGSKVVPRHMKGASCGWGVRGKKKGTLRAFNFRVTNGLSHGNFEKFTFIIKPAGGRERRRTREPGTSGGQDRSLKEAMIHRDYSEIGEGGGVQENAGRPRRCRRKSAQDRL